MNTYLWVEVKTSNKERFFLRCRGLKIDVLETRKNQENNLEVKILEKDFTKLKKIWFIKVQKKEVEGLKVIKIKAQKNRLFFIMIIIGLFFLLCVSQIIVKVEIIHSNKEIREIVKNSLENYGIKKNTWRKSYQEIEQIKEKVLNDYPETLEWLEIEQIGMTYKVRIEERKIPKKESEKKACHIVASKDGIIKELIYSKGVSLLKVNEAVKKGDIIISGIIKKDEEEKSVVCASGSVLGEVWYEVSVSVPMNYETSSKTGQKRWNLKLQNNSYHDFIFKSRLDHFEEETFPLFTIFGNTISFVRQSELVVSNHYYTEEEALNYALKSVDEKITRTLGDNEEILTKKVLKKEVNDSTMNVEVFVTVKETIGELQEFEYIRNGDPDVPLSH